MCRTFDTWIEVSNIRDSSKTNGAIDVNLLVPSRTSNSHRLLQHEPISLIVLDKANLVTSLQSTRDFRTKSVQCKTICDM